MLYCIINIYIYIYTYMYIYMYIHMYILVVHMLYACLVRAAQPIVGANFSPFNL